MEGLFVGNGPIRLTRNGTGLDDYILSTNPQGSWLDQADVLYLDQPVDVGFSYGNSVPKTMDAGAQDFINFMRLFLSVYPEYEKSVENRKVYLAGWSYAGKYIPLFSKYITQWSNTPDVPKINYVGALINNPLVAPVV